jgi:hypothetical protein
MSKAPRTIFLTNGDYENNIDFETDVNDGLVLWSQDKVTNHDVEYIRKDLYDKLKEKYDTLKSYTEHPWDCQMGS